MSNESNSTQNSSAKLVGALVGLLPPLFLEARVCGNGSAGSGDQIVTQLGLSVPAVKNMDVAIFSRTSGAAFAVGIGSFMAYKLLCRLIRSNCLWNALEQMSPKDAEQQQCSTAASETTGNNKPIELTEGFYAVRLGGENELLRQLDECLSVGSGNDAKNNCNQKVSIVQVRQSSALKQLFRRNHHIQRAGIASLDQCTTVGGSEDELHTDFGTHSHPRVRSGTLKKRSIARRWDQQQLDAGDDDDDDQSTLSNLTSASRIPPNPRHCEDSPPSALPDQFPVVINTPLQFHCSSIPSTSSSSSDGTEVCSTSLQLQFDNELCWENEFSSSNFGDVDGEKCSGLFLFREREDSLGGLSQLSAMKNIEQMFNRNWHDEERTTTTKEEEKEHEGEHLVESALQGLREMDRLDSRTTCTSSILGSLRHRQQTDEKDRQQRKGVENTETQTAVSAAAKSYQDADFPFTAYRIVLQNELDASEASSAFACSSSQTSTPRHKTNLRSSAGTSQGLWELTSPRDCGGRNSRATNEKSCHHHYQQMYDDVNAIAAGKIATTELLPSPSNLMVDSVISSHSSQASTSAMSIKHSVPMQQKRSATIGVDVGAVMYDSAIVTDIGDDDGCNWSRAKPETSTMTKPSDCMGNRSADMENQQTMQLARWQQNGIISRYGCDLSRISEHSTEKEDANASDDQQMMECQCQPEEQQLRRPSSGQPSISGRSMEWWF